MTRWDADINAAGASTRLSRSTVGDDGAVVESDEQLLTAARRVGGDMTRDEYTLARIIASELGDGTAAELLCIGDADLNRARAAGRSVYDHATAGHGYGRQGDPSGSPRPVATSKDPTVRHLRAVRALLAPGGARGIARGAQRYFDPKTQLALWRAGKAHHPLTILDRWTFNRAWAGGVVRDDDGRMTRPLGPVRPGGEEWTGPIAGVDAWELMLMRPQTAAQLELYREAVEVIESRGADQELEHDVLVRLGVCFAGAAAAVAFRAGWL